MSQYEVKFTQLSRYAETLVSEGEDRTKRFVRGLKPEVRSKLIPFQLQIYTQAVEKALEVERDMQEIQDMRIRELPSVKHPYTNIPSFGAYPTGPDRCAGSPLMPVQGTRMNSWPRGRGFPHVTSPISEIT